MTVAAMDFERLLAEHTALGRQYGEVQQRCSRVLAEQRDEIARLKAEVMGLRAAVIARDSALAYAREDRAELEASIPGLPKRLSLVRHIDMLTARLQSLRRERAPAPHVAAPRNPARLAGLEASLVAADLVICQTGCLSHGEYWRVQDHCKRTGKACVLTAEPEALRIVRIHKPDAVAASVDAGDPWVAEHDREIAAR